MQRLASLTRRVLLGLALACTLVASAPAGANGLFQAVDSITITVSDMDRALPFYEDVLTFEKVSDVEVAGEPYAPHGHVRPAHARRPPAARRRARRTHAGARPRRPADQLAPVNKREVVSLVQQ